MVLSEPLIYESNFSLNLINMIKKMQSNANSYTLYIMIWTVRFHVLLLIDNVIQRQSADIVLILFVIC